ncbi:chloride channel protein [Paraliobacillus ryukyuensis]|uniref:chloride channel protein n=1 Tax=Paraliobacillus ryukyuensis TaxID=200904 RepID=UPI0009A7BEA8|nr:chloride channel protein [Paraliobacillus ryukyuensis]
MQLKNNTLLSLLMQWIILGSIVGVVVGSTTTILLELNDFLGDDIRLKHDWLIFLLPFAGLLIGYIYMRFGKVMFNHSQSDTSELNNLVIKAVHGQKQVPKRMGLIVYLGTFLTVLFGGSTGREGAAIQMGGSVAATVNQLFRMNNIDKKVVLMSGISAGFGSAFGAPITGTVFGMEIATLGKLKWEAVLPCMTASFVAHFVTTAVWHHHHEIFTIAVVPETSVKTFFIVILLSIIFSLVSVLYCQLRHGIEKISTKLFKQNHMKRAFVGGVIIAILTWLIGSQNYNGRGLQILEQAFTEDVPPFAFLAKLIFTAITLGTGFVGGEAIPLFFIGATLGNTLHAFIDLPLSFFVALGLIAVFSGGTNTPIAAFLLALEMFNGKGLEFFFIACVISYLLSGTHGLWPAQKIYEPKSKLYQTKLGETIKQAEKRKKR